MSPVRFNRVVRKELDNIRRAGLIDAEAYGQLCRRYPTGRWDWRSLGRWFVIFGAISLAAGAVLLARGLFEFTLEKLAVLLGLGTLGLLAGGYALRRRDYLWTGRALELLGGFSLIGLSFTLGIIYSSGSGNWPALLLIDLILLLPLAYALRNILLLVLSAVVFFTWFGGVTGYVSGWGAYWFGMNYPLRFLLAGVAIALVGLLHRRAEHRWLAGYPGFFYVWLAGGVFFAEMALWLMSLFGNVGEIWGYYEESALELLLFNLLWMGFNGALLHLGLRYQLRMLRAFAVTYLIIQGYTLFFWYLAEHLGPILSLALGGGAALGLVAHLESRRRAAQAGAA